ncbi:unnamed protein product [Phytophthora fragariaefolia]|uniref:Unnamed protein product n=1 Tax=Phytophthora fragariaefolia TaxID=1490495 RepID=A0A9W6U8P4_9STRA|nr:unnamed protein product [Phytophthora fragariaefolia]
MDEFTALEHEMRDMDRQEQELKKAVETAYALMEETSAKAAASEKELGEVLVEEAEAMEKINVESTIAIKKAEASLQRAEDRLRKVKAEWGERILSERTNWVERILSERTNWVERKSTASSKSLSDSRDAIRAVTEFNEADRAYPNTQRSYQTVRDHHHAMKSAAEATIDA